MTVSTKVETVFSFSKLTQIGEVETSLVNLVNMEVQLRAIHMDDYNTIVNWSKDERFCLANDWPLDREEDELYTWWEQCVTSKKHNFVRLGIELQSKLIETVLD